MADPQADLQADPQDDPQVEEAALCEADRVDGLALSRMPGAERSPSGDIYFDSFQDIPSPRRMAPQKKSTGSAWTPKTVLENFGDGAPSSDGSRNAITLPESTHTLLFTEDFFSVPFGFALAIAAISISCLGLALDDAISEGEAGNPLGMPANVSHSVRAAQFISIGIALLMEEEIPTGLYLLRVITKSSVEEIGISYERFVASALCRLTIGYMFLSNVFLVIVQSERVLDIFYDMLALQFISMLDGISFRLAKLNILGKALKRACTSGICETEFERKPFALRRKMTIFSKSVFFATFLVLLGGMIAASVYQSGGYFLCSSITVDLCEEVWEHALVSMPGGTDSSMFLYYPFFNGVYEKQHVLHDERPVYRELRKSSDSNFETKIGAEIKYCKDEGAWVFTHDNIKKTETDESSCPWLLRSPDTEAYDLLDVSGQWSIWVGVIKRDAYVDITCNGCQVNTDCNFNGVCWNKQCQCDSNHTGIHCELETPCPQIISDVDKSTWSARFSPMRYCDDSDGEYLHQYGRPIYSLDHMGSLVGYPDLPDDDRLSLVFSGSRWLTIQLVGGENLTLVEIQGIRSDFHAFWDQQLEYKLGGKLISGLTSGSSPVGVDFYRIGHEDGDHYGPFGVLYPVQDPLGRYPFRCVDNVTKAVALASCKSPNNT